MSEEDTVIVLSDEDMETCLRNAYNDAGVTFTQLKNDVRECNCCFDVYDDGKFRRLWQATKHLQDYIPEDLL